MSLHDDFFADDTVPVICANNEGLITFINTAFEETFRWSAQLLVGKPLSAIIPKNMRDAHNMGFSKYIITRSPTLLNQPLNLQIQCGDGEILTAEHRIVALQKDGDDILAAKIIPR